MGSAKTDAVDALSHTLALYPARTALDVRCQLGAPWIIDHVAEPPGVAPYHLIVSGTAWLDCAAAGDSKGHGASVELQAGDIILLPRGSAHRLRAGHAADAAAAAPVQVSITAGGVQFKHNDGAGPPADILCGKFEFDHGAANPVLMALPEVLLVRTAGRADFASLQALMAMLRAETETMQPGANVLVSHLSSALFALLMRVWLEQSKPAAGLFALLGERRLLPALQGMLAAPGHPWSLNELAQRCHMSRASFVRLFNLVAGATPATVLLQTRMAQAAAWLARHERSVRDIGEAVGYQSEAAFNRAFKRYFGVGPGLYRSSGGAALPLFSTTEADDTHE